MTMATSSALSRLLLLVNTLILDHVFYYALHRVCVLESVTAEPELQPC